MPDLHELSDRDGRSIGCRPDGMLCTVGAGHAPDDVPLLVALGADGGSAMLLEVPGRSLRFDPGQEVGRPVEAVRIDGLRDGMVLLRTGGDGRFLRLCDGIVHADADASDAASPFRLRRSDKPMPSGSLLARIPAPLDFDAAGLCTIFAAGDAALLPVLDTLLAVLPIHTVRDGWAATPPVPARDVFHPMVRAQSRSRAGAFQGYVADRLKPFIDAHGWSIGEGSYGAPRLLEVGRGTLTIGRYCSMADPCIVLGNHDARLASSYPFVDLWAEWPGATLGMTDHVSGDVVIGNDVWIGVDATILPGAVIGDGAVIGAGCCVRGAVPPYAICVGNPGTVRHYRFGPETIDRLLRLRWWDWPAARIDRALPLLLSREIEAFLLAAEQEDAAAAGAANPEQSPA